MPHTNESIPSLVDLAREYGTDKNVSHRFLANYERHFAHLRDKPVKILELGVLRGGSLRMWHRYFEHGLIVGIDINKSGLTEVPDRVRFYQGSQDDGALLDRVARECAPEGFDIVIDDASHIGTLSRSSFQHLFQAHVKSGGIYVVEDWCTGYWPAWPDGSKFCLRVRNQHVTEDRWTYRLLRRTLRKLVPGWARRDIDFNCHNFGMVGFVKELVDEVAWPDISDPSRGNPHIPPRDSLIAQMAVYVGQVYLTKT